MEQDVVDTIAAKLDDKFGFRQGELTAEIESLRAQVESLKLADVIVTLSQEQDQLGARLARLEARMGLKP